MRKLEVVVAVVFVLAGALLLEGCAKKGPVLDDRFGPWCELSEPARKEYSAAQCSVVR